jgi:Mn2+/Fe2+ NRAMP family transporter
MTADHWMQIAAIVTPSITALTVCGLTLRAASRSSHPNPAPEAQIAPQTTSTPMRSKKLWIVTWLSIFVSIIILCFDMRPAPLTRFVVASIASNIAAISFLFMMLYILSITDIFRGMIRTHESLHEFVKAIAVEIQNRPNIQT